jgi:phosphatidylglycerol:prolipoprotein diacylglycerol transferase
LIPQSPGYIFISIGDLAITWYGLCIVIAAAAGLYVLLRKTQHNKKLSESIFDIALWSIVAGFIGARAYHVWNEWWWYHDHLDHVYRIWEGGLAIHGGLLASMLVMFLLARKKKILFFQIAGLFAPALLVAQAIGRWGNYFNEELFGKPLHTWWALHVSLSARPVQYMAEQTFHPLFLYEMVLNLLLFAIIMIAWKKLSPTRGVITAIYFIGYGAIRFALDFFRFDQFGFGPFTLAQWVSLCLIFMGGVLLYYQRFWYKKG